MGKIEVHSNFTNKLYFNMFDTQKHKSTPLNSWTNRSFVGFQYENLNSICPFEICFTTAVTQLYGQGILKRTKFES